MGEFGFLCEIPVRRTSLDDWKGLLIDQVTPRTYQILIKSIKKEGIIQLHCQLIKAASQYDQNRVAL